MDVPLTCRTSNEIEKQEVMFHVEQKGEPLRPYLLVILSFTIIVVARCAPPKVSEMLGDGINCKAEITMPEAPRAGDPPVEVKVRIFDCSEVESREGFEVGNAKSN